MSATHATPAPTTILAAVPLTAAAYRTAPINHPMLHTDLAVALQDQLGNVSQSDNVSRVALAALQPALEMRTRWSLERPLVARVKVGDEACVTMSECDAFRVRCELAHK